VRGVLGVRLAARTVLSDAGTSVVRRFLEQRQVVMYPYDRPKRSAPSFAHPGSLTSSSCVFPAPRLLPAC
jgi:hypothetical protein